MRVGISHLPNGVHTLNVTGRPDDFELEENDGFENQIHVQLKLDKGRDTIYLQLASETMVRVECDRCLDGFEKKVNAEARIVFTRDASLTENDDDVRDLELYQAELDIKQDVHDALLLAFPLKKLCQSECKGLCPQCGENLNVNPCDCKTTTTDPRWEALRQLSEDRRN